MVAPLVVVIISGASALLSGGGVAVYCKNKYQKEINKLQTEVVILQKEINLNHKKLAAKQKLIADLQQKITGRDELITDLMFQGTETDALILTMRKKIKEHSSFWRKIVAGLQSKINNLKEDKDELIEKLEKTKAETLGIEGVLFELISAKESKTTEIKRLEEEGMVD